jgi:hypothetical protein
MPTVDELNAAMRRIFATHHIDPGVGEEMFWEAVESVRAVDPADADRLEDLAEQWAVANRP